MSEDHIFRDLPDNPVVKLVQRFKQILDGIIHMKSAPLDIVNIYHHYFPEDQIFNVLSQLDPLIDYLYKYDYDNLDEWRESNHNRFTCMVGKNPCYFTLHEIPGGYQWVWQYYTPTTKSSDVSYADIPRELVEDMFNIITEKYTNPENYSRLEELYNEYVAMTYNAE